MAAALQVTISSETWPQAVQAAAYAVFRQRESLLFDTVCNGSRASSGAKPSAVRYTAATDADFCSGIAPWFYSAGAACFEVASNVTKQQPHSLGTLLLNASVTSFCADFRSISMHPVTMELQAELTDAAAIDVKR